MNAHFFPKSALSDHRMHWAVELVVNLVAFPDGSLLNFRMIYFHGAF